MARSAISGALAALVLASCGGSAAPAPATTTGAPSSSASAGASVASTVAKPAASASSTAKPSAAASGQLRPLKISVPTKGSAFSYLYVAKDLGFFEQHGIDAQIAVVPPANAVTALQSGDLDYAATIGSTIRAALRGLPVRVVMVGSNRPDFVILGQKGLTSLDQLSGKLIGSDAPQTTTFVMLTELMKRKGLAGKYQTLTAANDEGRVALVTNGQAAACIIEVSTARIFEKQGYSELAPTTDFPEEPFVGLGASQAAIQKKGDVLRDGLQAVLQGIDAMRNQKDKVVPIMAKEFDLSAEDAGQIFDALRPNWTADGKPSQAANDFEFANDKDALELKELPKPEQVYDFSLLDQLSKK